MRKIPLRLKTSYGSLLLMVECSESEYKEKLEEYALKLKLIGSELQAMGQENKKGKINITRWRW